VDSAGTPYVVDATNNRIRKVTPAGEVSTFAGTEDAGTTYVSDSANHRIRTIKLQR